MGETTVFKKSIWRKVDERTKDIERKAKQKAAEIKKSIADPEQQEKIKMYAMWTAAGVLFVLKVRKELSPTLADIERYQKAHSFYDPHTHIRFATCKKVTPEVANEILERTSKGERAYDILKEKKLIK